MMKQTFSNNKQHQFPAGTNTQAEAWKEKRVRLHDASVISAMCV